VTNLSSKVFQAIGVSLITSIEFLAAAGFLFFYLYVWKKRKYWHLKIQQRFPEKKHILRDIKYSFYTSAIYGVVMLWVMWASKIRLTRVYYPIDKYGYDYYVFSILLMVFIHDTYFYWTHRLLHWKPIFKKVHVVHHLSLDPTPFSAYAFHPLEAFIEVGILPLIVFTVPYHVSALTIFLTYALLMNVMGHMGYEFFPKGFAGHKVLKWHNSATHHNMHHRYTKCNYGLYFNLWDRIMKTNHQRYEQIFDDVIEQRNRTKTIKPGNTALATADEYFAHEEELLN
jgi:lathosterol oxidase